MGRRNTRPKSYLQVFQRLNWFVSVDSNETLPCLGLIEYSPKDQVLEKHNRNQQISRVLHRPVEPARLHRMWRFSMSRVRSSGDRQLTARTTQGPFELGCNPRNLRRIISLGMTTQQSTSRGKDGGQDQICNFDYELRDIPSVA
jgi:hypothetical protein